MNPCNVVLVDDHTLFAKALKTLISSFEEVYVNFVAGNGLEFIQYLEAATQTPDVVLLDVRMPRMDGIATMRWIKEHRPEINVLAITMEDDDETITKMIRHGCKGYLLKDIEPKFLNAAIRAAASGDFVYSDHVNKEVFEQFRSSDRHLPDLIFNEKEQEFLNFVCGTDLSYKQIAEELSLSKSTIDNRREHLFLKLGVQSRISAVLFAVQHQLVTK